MRILQATSELHPFSKTGGLADMVAALAKALAAAGHTVGVISPLYRDVWKKAPGLRKMDWWIHLPLGDRRLDAEVWTLEPAPQLTLYFIHQPELFDRNGIYGDNTGTYSDNDARFVFLSKCAVQMARYLTWQPEILHLHDWQTAIAPLLVQHLHQQEDWVSPPKTVLTIHNLAYQGVFEPKAYHLTNLPRDYFHSEGAEFHGTFNCLKTGLVFADELTTVSPRYAREVTTPEFGCGLDGVIRRRQASLVGILNGVDYDEWKTMGNPHLPASYSVNDLSGKAVCKASLQRELGLPAVEGLPVFATVSRLADQKGMDIELAALEQMLAAPLQAVVLGSGSSEFERGFAALARRFPDRLAVRLAFDHTLAHRIEAGSDFFLMPSRFEPCGLNQMYSLRYGTIPIVRRTGGLDDSVIDYREDPEGANGIKFDGYTDRALAKAIRKALALYAHPAALRQFQLSGMRADFSWDRTEREFAAVYEGLLGKGIDPNTGPLLA